MRNSHMPLAKIKMYMILYHQGDETIVGRRNLLKEHYEVIKKEIEDLQDIEKYLKEKMSIYDKKYKK